MSPLWRLTRNRFGRRLHALLDGAGVTVSRLYEYRASLPTDTTASTPSGVAVRRSDASTLPAGTRFDGPTDAESVLAAVEVATGRTVGSLFICVDGTVPVPELRTERRVDGGYIRRLYVAPDSRRRGIASALVEAATTAAADRGAETATALVAIDNRPSRRTFENRGFEPVARVAYDRIGRYERRRRRPLIRDEGN